VRKTSGHLNCGFARVLEDRSGRSKQILSANLTRWPAGCWKHKLVAAATRASLGDFVRGLSEKQGVENVSHAEPSRNGMLLEK
jgi:hypothetical protein